MYCNIHLLIDLKWLIQNSNQHNKEGECKASRISWSLFEVSMLELVRIHWLCNKSPWITCSTQHVDLGNDERRHNTKNQVFRPRVLTSKQFCGRQDICINQIFLNKAKQSKTNQNGNLEYVAKYTIKT